MKADISCWNFLDKAYCISLVERSDRRRAAHTEFDKVGLAEKIEYVLVERRPLNSEQGIYESHMDCIRRGLQAGAERIAIFEDDVVFDGFDPQRMARSFGSLENIGNWGIFFLGCLVSGSRPTPSPDVRIVQYRSLAHAYILSRACAQNLSEIDWSGKPYDAMLQESIERPYAIYPSIAFQSSAKSDNTRRRWLDVFRRLCGGLHLIQKMNERYHRHTRMILVIHLVLAAIAATGWLLWKNRFV